MLLEIQDEAKIIQEVKNVDLKITKAKQEYESMALNYRSTLELMTNSATEGEKMSNNFTPHPAIKFSSTNIFDYVVEAFENLNQKYSKV